MSLRISLLLALLLHVCVPMVLKAQDHFSYERTFEEHQPDAVFESVLDVTFDLGNDFGGPKLTVYRGPTQIFGVKGNSRTLQGGKLECVLLPEEVKEIRQILDGLDVQRFPDKPDFSQSGKVPWGMVTYGEVIRGFAVLPEPGPARKVDEAMEGIVKKITAKPASRWDRFWEPRIRTFPGDDQPARVVTLAELVADPLKFHRQRVRVTGYYEQGFEISALSAGDASVWVGGNSFFADKKAFDPSAVKGKQTVMIDGTFDAGEHGHMGGWCGTIERTTRMVAVKGATLKTP